MVICLERGADLHMAQLMPLPLTVSCFSKIQIGFIFLVPAHLGSPGKRAVKWVCVNGCVSCHFFFGLPLLFFPPPEDRSTDGLAGWSNLVADWREIIDTRGAVALIARARRSV